MNSQLIEYKSFQIRFYLLDNGWTAEILDQDSRIAYPPVQGKSSLAKALGAAYEDANWLIRELYECLADW
ncbi:hypothetical protein [Microcoleus sp. AT9b-C5]|uniref:hypothetical protein n=1 Tax=unclassified Microcoleus TaxID=2642155 RepID=UPI002FD5783F